MDPYAARRRATALFRADGQTLATLGPSAFQNESSVLRAHPGPEAVRLPAAAVVRLKGALHESAVSVAGRADYLLGGERLSRNGVARRLMEVFFELMTIGC